MDKKLNNNTIESDIIDINIEVSIKIDIKDNISNKKEFLSYIANNNNAKDNYFSYECEGINNTIERNECIQITNFNNIDNIINYIKDINKKKIKIDCVYIVSPKIKYIYISNSHKNNHNIDNKEIKHENMIKKNIINLIREYYQFN